MNLNQIIDHERLLRDNKDSLEKTNSSLKAENIQNEDTFIDFIYENFELKKELMSRLIKKLYKKGPKIQRTF